MRQSEKHRLHAVLSVADRWRLTNLEHVRNVRSVRPFTGAPIREPKGRK